MKPTRLRSRKRTKNLRKRTQRRKLRAGGNLRESAIAAIPDARRGEDKLEKLLFFIMDHSEAGYVHKINIGDKTYVYEQMRGGDPYIYVLVAHEKSNPDVRVALYSYVDH